MPPTEKENCYVCDDFSTTKAHVRDKDDCLKEGIDDHNHQNRIPMCYYHHYMLFDKGYLGIRIEEDGRHIFVFFDIEDDYQMKQQKSLQTLDIMADYIIWKNRRCNVRLHPFITLDK